jgi:hypothetical protein
MRGRGRAELELRLWAQEEGREIFALQPCSRPPDSVVEQFPRMSPPGPNDVAGGVSPGLWQHPRFRYFTITTIDGDHVRHSGFARVQPETHTGDYDWERSIDFVWLTSEQLNWRDRPPRRSAKMPSDRAEGWYTDHTRAHELRWYSVGTPTDLVKDGAIESRDAPAPPAEYCG